MLQKSNRMTHVRYDIRGLVSEAATRLELEGHKIIKLNTGNPAAFDISPPGYAEEILGKKLKLTAPYSDSKGLRDVREAIARYESGKGIPGISVDNIFTGNGVSELISISLQALLNDGDEVLIPTPDYPLWTAAVHLSGGKPVHYTCDEQANWFPDIEDLRRKLTPKTRAIVVISPNNPTGAVYPREVLEQIVQVARENGLLIFSDEIYDRLLMDGHQHVAVGSLAPDLPVATFNGLSKSHQLCGYRAGWLVFSGDLSGAQEYIDAITVLASMRLCSNVTGQAIIPAALEDSSHSQGLLEEGGRLFDQRGQAYDGLRAIPGISVVKAMAGLYMFPKLDIKKLRINDDEQFVFDFLRAKHVLLTHGRGYNWPAPDHFRMVYLPEKEVLADVVERLADFLDGYRQY